jgi:hypothetical protein
LFDWNVGGCNQVGGKIFNRIGRNQNENADYIMDGKSVNSTNGLGYNTGKKINQIRKNGWHNLFKYDILISNNYC